MRVGGFLEGDRMHVQEIVRRAGAEDVETLVRMRIALLQAVGNVTGESEVKKLGDAIRTYLAQEMPVGRYVAFIAEAGGYAVGCGGLAFYLRPPYHGNPGGKEAYLMGMYTIPERRGKGVGTALIEKLLEYARAQGVARVWLHAEPGARSLYSRAGFCSNDAYMELTC
jgi:GNAT superfamily N-acetyltransferase